ncbi:MAG TPA: CHAD domain-containing protein [Candidatus Methylacidiphilales bacterium]|nr:CHAD domain-containing protein [Candidatus Methylacidiphilales bacterium]
MAFRPFQLKPGEGLRGGLIRIVNRIAKKSATLPDFRTGKAEETIHEARLLIKLLRAIVGMAGTALGKAAGQRIKTCLRAAARSLAGPRDAAVLASTLSKLARKASGNRRQADYILAGEELDRNLTVTDEAAARRKLAVASRYLERTTLLFGRGAERTAPLWPSAAECNCAAARACRKAMKRAFSSGRADDFHDWRKKAKRFFLQLGVMENLPGQRRGAAAGLLNKLQSKLGTHHDLVMLEEHLKKNPAFPNQPDLQWKILRDIRHQRRDLEKELKPLGKKCRRVCAEWLKT